MADIDMDRPAIPAGIPTFNLVFSAVDKLQKDYQQFKKETNAKLERLADLVKSLAANEPENPNILEIKDDKKVKK